MSKKKEDGGGGALVGNIPALSQYVSTLLPRGSYPANTNKKLSILGPLVPNRVITFIP